MRALHVEPYNLALGKPCRQINIYNEQGPQLGINGDVDGDLKKCIHTQVCTRNDLIRISETYGAV